MHDSTSVCRSPHSQNLGEPCCIEDRVEDRVEDVSQSVVCAGRCQSILILAEVARPKIKNVFNFQYGNENHLGGVKILKIETLILAGT